MSTKANTSNGSDVRDKHIVVGVDTRGVHHHYHTDTETVHLIHPGGGRGRKVLGSRSINHYIDAVEEAYGWESQRLFKTMGDALGDKL